jgi:hypothetical protein
MSLPAIPRVVDKANLTGEFDFTLEYSGSLPPFPGGLPLVGNRDGGYGRHQHPVGLEANGTQKTAKLLDSKALTLSFFMQAEFGRFFSVFCPERSFHVARAVSDWRIHRPEACC